MRWMTTALAVAGPTARAARRAPFLAAAGAGLAIVAVPAAMSVTLAPDNLAMLLRFAVVSIAVGVVFLLDDPAKPTTAATPAPPWLTTAVRVAGALAAASVWWAAAVAVTLTGAQDGTGEQVPLGGLSLEAAAIVMVALALAVVSWRRAERGVGSTGAVPALLALLTAGALLPGNLHLLVNVDSAQWTAVHQRWAVLLALAVVAVPVGATARWPLRRAVPAGTPPVHHHG